MLMTSLLNQRRRCGYRQSQKTSPSSASRCRVTAASLAFTAHDGRILLADASRGQWRSSELKASGTTRAVCFSHDSTKLTPQAATRASTSGI